ELEASILVREAVPLAEVRGVEYRLEARAEAGRIAVAHAHLAERRGELVLDDSREREPRRHDDQRLDLGALVHAPAHDGHELRIGRLEVAADAARDRELEHAA